MRFDWQGWFQEKQEKQEKESEAGRKRLTRPGGQREGRKDEREKMTEMERKIDRQNETESDWER